MLNNTNLFIVVLLIMLKAAAKHELEREYEFGAQAGRLDKRNTWHAGVQVIFKLFVTHRERKQLLPELVAEFVHVLVLGDIGKSERWCAYQAQAEKWKRAWAWSQVL